MKNILALLITFFTVFISQSQTYTELTIPNFVPISEMIIEIQKDEAFYVLNHQVGSTKKTYQLINKTSVVYTFPTLPLGWSSQTLYKANKSIQPYDLGGTFIIVVDSEGNSYLRIH